MSIKEKFVFYTLKYSHMAISFIPFMIRLTLLLISLVLSFIYHVTVQMLDTFSYFPAKYFFKHEHNVKISFDQWKKMKKKRAKKKRKSNN